MIRHLLRRSWLILALAAAAAAAAWATTLGEEVRYEARLTWVMQPADTLENDRVPDALRGLAAESGQLKNTVAAVLSSGRYLDLAAEAALGRSVRGYSLDVQVHGSSDILTVVVIGPEPTPAERIAAVFTPIAAEWLRGIYRAYQLDLLATAPAVKVETEVLRTVILGGLLGGLLAIGVVYAEGRARQTRERVEATMDAAANVVSVEDLTGRTDQIEVSLREHLQAGESVVRLGPNRLRIVRTATRSQTQRGPA